MKTRPSYGHHDLSGANKTVVLQRSCLVLALILGVLLGLNTGLKSAAAAGLDDLPFDHEATKRGFLALDSCLRGMVGPEWRHIPYHTGGNFYQAAWCRGPGARGDCVIAHDGPRRPDQHVLTLYTLFYGRQMRETFGLGLNVLYTPPGRGIGCRIYFAEGGRTIVGEGLSLGFFFYDEPGKPTSELELRASPQYKVHETGVGALSELTLRQDLARFVESPASLRDHGLKKLEALLAKVKETIRSHKVMTCEFGPYKGDGVPPECRPRPLTPDEERQALARAEKDFADQMRLIKERYQELHQALLKAFPFDRCRFYLP
ncbi:MAG: hypothetical protein AB1641_21270 [Thermodesulfobacteriota bacterium]